MSIRLRFTLLYNAILALTLAVFGLGLYSVQAQTTYTALKKDLIMSSEHLEESVSRAASSPNPNDQGLPPEQPRPVPFDKFSGDQAFKELPEREIVRVLDAAGNLVASPSGQIGDAMPLSPAGLKTVQNVGEVWETASYQGQSMLIYTRAMNSNHQTAYFLQVARPLTERNRSLQLLVTTILIASLVTILVAFGIGWILSGLTLQPIHRLTQTAKSIGDERDFTRRVVYTGPQDEVGQLATTFNGMLARLQDAFQQVGHSLEMQRDFVADVSHELRTPLTTLRGNLGLLLREPPISVDEKTDILTDMVDESDRLIRLVNDLLAQARADAGRSLAKEPVDILAVLEDTCRQVSQLDEHRNTHLEADDLTIRGDRDALKQVLLIALDNAMKHSDSDIQVTAHLNENQVEIRVSDSGEGIPPDKLEHVFDRFYRGEGSTIIEGYGLGLSIAKSLVEGMDGTIQLESIIGSGSVLVLRFPI